MLKVLMLSFLLGPLAAHASGITLHSGHARVFCRDHVKEQLRSPSTARFSNQSEEETSTGWIATGSVDAQNAFGATVRNSYRCVITGKTYETGSITSSFF